MAPRLSVIVAGSRPGGPKDALFRVLQSPLQTGAIELLLATARSGECVWPGARVVQCAPGSIVPAMRLAGVRAATAPLIALTEDFCVPGHGWVEALLDAHTRIDASIFGGPIARRGGCASDWALTLVEYGRFFRREPEGEVSDLCSINVAYDAERLRAALPSDAEGLFEVQLHARLRTRGDRFWRIPDALMFDENDRPLLQAMRAQYHHGRLFAGERVQGRGLLLSLARCALAPAVPAVLLKRIAIEAAAAGDTAEVWRSLPALSLLLGAWSLGEAIGSLFGKGHSAAFWT